MSLSLVAVFIPILLMGGVVGRLFREFAVTLSAAIAVSLVVSLTLTPMMCARLLRAELAEPRPPGRLARWSERGFVAMQDGYRRTLGWALAHGRLMMLILAAAVGLNVYLYAVVPAGFFPQQDTGQLLGFFRVDQGTSFQATVPKLDALRKVVLADPAVQSMTGFAGGRGGSNSSFMQIQLCRCKSAAYRPTWSSTACAASCRTCRARACSWWRSRTSASAAVPARAHMTTR